MYASSNHAKLYANIQEVLKREEVRIAEGDEIAGDVVFESGRTVPTLGLSYLGKFKSVAEFGSYLSSKLNAKSYIPFNDNVGVMVVELEKGKLERVVLMDNLRCGQIPQRVAA